MNLNIQKISGTILALTGILSVLMLFQNCAAPIGEGQQGMQSYDVTPFAFDIKYDSISYLSCDAGAKLNQPHFVLGAIKPGVGGLQMTREYKTFSGLTQPDFMQRRLLESPKNANIKTFLSLRGPAGECNQGYLCAESSTNWIAQSEFTLSNIAVVTELLSTDSDSDRFQFFDDLPGLGERSLRLGLGLGSTSGGIIGAREYLEGSGLLVAGYSSPDQTSDVIVPLGPNQENLSELLYGSGFKLQFSPVSATDDQNRYLSSVTERNMQTGELIDQGQWHCPEDARIMIVRRNDWEADKLRCKVGPDSSSNSLLRQLIDPAAEHWLFGLTSAGNRPCAVSMQEEVSCYANTTSTVEYSVGHDDCTSSGTDGNHCPHYISLCHFE